MFQTRLFGIPRNDSGLCKVPFQEKQRIGDGYKRIGDGYTVCVVSRAYFCIYWATVVFLALGFGIGSAYNNVRRQLTKFFNF